MDQRSYEANARRHNVNGLVTDLSSALESLLTDVPEQEPDPGNRYLRKFFHETYQPYRLRVSGYYDPKIFGSGRTLRTVSEATGYAQDGFRDYKLHFYRRLEKIFDAAGLPKTAKDKFHKIRRTCATLIADIAGDEAAQKHLGHSSLSLTRSCYLDPRYIRRRIIPADQLPRPHDQEAGAA